jgi:prepilin peptidase CpaA
LENIVETIVLILGIALFAVVAYGDVKTLRIPNALVAAVAILGIARLVVIGDLTVAFYTISASAALLIVTFLLFWQGYVGGGDAKLITASALLVGYHDLFSFLVFMGICGALLSLAVLVIHRYLPLYEGPRLGGILAKLAVPYGVAIAAAGGVTLFCQSPFLSSLIR